MDLKSILEPMRNNIIAIAALAILGGIGIPAAMQISHEYVSPHVIISGDSRSGSAVHIGDGYFLTVSHVTNRRKTMTVRNEAGDEAELEVLWENQTYDVALLAGPDDFVDAAPLSCGEMSIGDAIYAYGNPASYEFVRLAGTVAGFDDGNNLQKDMMLTDLTTIPGMSGGAIIDRTGSVVGIATQVLIYGTSMTAMGAAAPSTVICMLMGR